MENIILKSELPEKNFLNKDTYKKFLLAYISCGQGNFIVTFPYFISLPIKTLSSGFIAIFSFKCTCFEGDRRQEKMNILYDKC
jgi:hypothetical protein